MFRGLFVGGECLSKQVYLRCTNPGCGKMTPVYSEVVPGEEYTCVFCGFLFNAPEDVVEVVGKRRDRVKKPVRREVKPENRNLTKP